MAAAVIASLAVVPQASASKPVAKPDVITRVAKATPCPSARSALAYYQMRYSTWVELRGGSHTFRLGQPRGCAYISWLAERWQGRALQERERYLVWKAEQARRTLRDFKTGTGVSAYLRAVEEVQRPYPGTRSWLLSCAADEGGYGRWVPNSQGSGAGGWLQFMESTFWRMFGAAKPDVESRGFIVPRSAASWYSPLGQALAGAWGVSNGRAHEWSGAGC